MRNPFRLMLALGAIVLVAGCVPPLPAPADTMIDLRGSWMISSAPVGRTDPNHSITPERLMITGSTVLNPFGADCAERVHFVPEPLVPFGEMVAARGWPEAWTVQLLNGNARVQEVTLTCGTRPLLHLIPLAPDLALAPLDNGDAVIMRKTDRRPG
jgi:hypothetical protein